MKTLKKLFSLLLVLCLLFSITGNAFAASYTGDTVAPGLSGIQPGDELTHPDNNTNVSLSDDGKVTNITGPGLIPFTKTWTGGSDAVRPDSITVKLYKYLGDSFNVSTATLVESKTLTAADDWKYTFDISGEALYSGTSYSSNTAYKWAVVEDDVAGYTEAAHTDPSVVFNPPEVAGSGWNRITPCSEINITTSGNDKSIVCAKKGNSAIVWSVDPLSQAERDMIQNSARSGISGAGGIQSFSFISGFGTSSAFGLTVTETQIQFSDSSAWSFFATGVYNKSSTQANASSITNNYAPEAATFAIPVTKVVEGTPTAASSFEFTLTPITDGAPMPANDGAALTITGAGSGSFGEITYTEPGTWVYSVSETAGSATGYTYDNTTYLVTVTVTDTNGTLGAVASVKTVAGVNVDAAVFTNTYSTGNLIVTKTVDGNAGSTTKEFSFTVTLKDTSISGTYGDMTFVNGVATFTLTDGGSKTAEGLPNGVGYTVVEADYSADGYVTTKSGDTGTITDGQTATAAFTNTKNTTPPTPPTDPEVGNLTVSKTISGNAADSTKEFSFTVTLGDTTINGTYGAMSFSNGVATFTLKGGESKTATNLPAGTTFTVAEADYSADGYVTTKSGDTGTITDGQTATAAFTNTKNTTPPTPPVDPKFGNLTISKNVTGDLGDKTKYFTFKVEFNVDGTFSYIGSKTGTITNGGTIQLKHGESITIVDIPAGTSYTVTESGNSGYSVYASGDTGIISDGKTSTAKFTNTRSSVPKTGDHSNVPLWFSLMGISVLGMIGTLFIKTNKRRKAAHLRNK